jgi:NADPH:quinone reductase-like Zn-dependent oxidoreductase
MTSTALLGGRRAKFGISLPDASVMDEIRSLAESGVLRPVIAERFPLDRIADAHAHAERSRSSGATIVALPSYAG